MGEFTTNIHCPLCGIKVFKTEKGYQCSCGTEFILDITNKPISSSTNSLVGSYHWFSTLTGHIRRSLEYIAEHSLDTNIKSMAEKSYTACTEVMEGFKLINHSS